MATCALLALTGAELRERAWALTLLGAGVALSTAGNVIHALTNDYRQVGTETASMDLMHNGVSPSR